MNNNKSCELIYNKISKYIQCKFNNCEKCTGNNRKRDEYNNELFYNDLNGTFRLILDAK